MTLSVPKTANFPSNTPGTKEQREMTKVASAVTALNTQHEVGAATCSSNAATLNTRNGKITSESLSTAAAAAQALTITCNKVAAGDIVHVTRIGGTSATGTPIIKAVAGDGSFVITLDNKHASAAFNGTFILGYSIIPLAGLA